MHRVFAARAREQQSRSRARSTTLPARRHADLGAGAASVQGGRRRSQSAAGRVRRRAGARLPDLLVPRLQLTGNALADLLLGLPLVHGRRAALDNPQRLRDRNVWRCSCRTAVRLSPDAHAVGGPSLRATLHRRWIQDDRANVYDPVSASLVQVGTGGIAARRVRAGLEQPRPAHRRRLVARRAARTVCAAAMGSTTASLRSPLAKRSTSARPISISTCYFPLPGLPLTLDESVSGGLSVRAAGFGADVSSPIWQTPFAASLERERAAAARHSARGWRSPTSDRAGVHLIAARDLNQPAPSPIPSIRGRIPRSTTSPRSNRARPRATTRCRLEFRSASRTRSVGARVRTRSASRQTMRRDSFRAPATRTSRRTATIRPRRRPLELRRATPALGEIFCGCNLPQPQARRRARRSDSRRLAAARHRSRCSPAGRSPWPCCPTSTTATPAARRSALVPTIVRTSSASPVSRDPCRSAGSTRRVRVSGLRHLRQRGPEHPWGTRAIRMSTRRCSNRCALSPSPRCNLRLEAFNLFNRANFDLPDNFLGSPTFGQVLSAQSPRRVQIGARVLF